MLVLVAGGSLRAAEKTPTSAPLPGRVERFTKIETLPVGAYEVAQAELREALARRVFRPSDEERL